MRPTRLADGGFAPAPPAPGDRAPLRLLGASLRPHLLPALAGAGLALVSSGLELAGPILLRRAVDRGVIAGSTEALNLYGALFLLAATGSAGVLRAATALTGRAGEAVLRDLRVRAFRHLTRLPLAQFERERTGSLVSRVTSDVEAVERLVTESLVRLAMEVLFLFGAGIVLFVLDVRLALAAMTALPLMLIATSAFRRRSHHAYGAVRERIASVLSFLQEGLRGVHVVQAFGREKHSSARFRKANEEWADASVGAWRLESLYFPGMELLSLAATAAVLVYGGGRVMSGDLTLGVLTAFTVYLSQFFGPIHHLSEHFSTFQQAVAGLHRIAGLLARAPEAAETGERHPVATDPDGSTSNGRVQAVPNGSRVDGRIALQDIWFRYTPDAAWALRGASLEVAPGTTAALVGTTGAGKSTIFKLVARFYEPTRGVVRLDGADLGAQPLAAVRSHLALVAQEGFLFGGTIRENIRFGRPDASDEEIEELCGRLGIDGWLQSLASGYETDVRQRGARLSAGERQLIALARAALADRPLLLLDEATSSLDPGTARRVEVALRKVLAGRTCLLIAHRLSTAMHADRIFVVDDGKVVEDGTHRELVEAGGRYAALYRHWLSGAATPPGPSSERARPA